VNIFKRWESRAALEAFRSGGPAPSNAQAAAMLSASVAECDIADVRPLFGEGAAWTCGTERAATDEVGAFGQTEQRHHERKDDHKAYDHHARLRRRSDAGDRRA
jgi:hypothetical protein